MKHLRTLSLILCILLLALTAASCSAPEGAPQKLYEGTFAEKTPVLTKAEKTSLTDVTAYQTGFVLTGNHTVYDMVSGKTVLTYTPAENETVELSGCQVGDARCFALLCETEKDGVTGYKTLLYSEAGSLLKQAESKSGPLMPTVTLDLLVLDDAVFRANGTALEGAGSVSAFGNHIDDFKQKRGSYYYGFNDDSFSVYRSDGSFYDIYVFESADSKQHTVLANGNVLIQYTRALPDDAKQYDYFDGGKKIALTTYLWQADKKAAKEITFAYSVGRIFSLTQETRDRMAKETGMTYAKGLENFARLKPVKNQALGTEVWVTLKNDGSIGTVLSDTYKGLDRFPEPLKDGVFYYTTLGGQVFLIDGKGKLLRDVSSVDQVLGQYFVADNRLYDADSNLIFDFGKEGYRLEKVYGNIAILRSGTESIRFKGNARSTMTDIRSADTVSFEDTYYTVTDATGETAYCAPDGTVIYKSRAPMTLVHEFGEKLLFTDTENGETVYVLFTVK